MPSIRLCFGLIAMSAGLAIVAALIMQYQFDMEPCPLCISQRIFVILVGVSAGIGSLFTYTSFRTRLFSSIGMLFAIIGGGVSARHVWIQNLPEDEVPICGPGLSYMFETRPMFDALGLLFSGDGHCAEISFRFLGLSIPGWTLVFFIGLCLSLAWLFWRSMKQK